MSEVMRWKLKGFIPGVEGVSKALFQPWVVPAEDFDRVVAERDGLQLLLNSVDQRRDELESLLEQVLENTNRALPSSLLRSIRGKLPARAPCPAADETEREPFEAWHRSRFATKHSTGQPTRDMHNGILDPEYGPPVQQQMWEAWQARAHLNKIQP